MSTLLNDFLSENPNDQHIVFKTAESKTVDNLLFQKPENNVIEYDKA